MRDTHDRTYSFGYWLHCQRKARDLTQQELAAQIGCTRDLLHKIETDRRRPGKMLAERIARVLGLHAEIHPDVVRAARGQLPVDRLPLSLQPVRLARPQAATLPPQRHQLRTPLPDFVGHQEAITTLLAAFSQAIQDGQIAAISGVRGMGGVGKTELAILLANRLTDTFPDAQIVLNLRGASVDPLPPSQALRQVIYAFTPDAKLPDDLEGLQRHYRSVLHGKRVLILADDAYDAQQVRPLLPPVGCALIVTSRLRFSLPGMTAVDLEIFSEAEAVRLLHTICARLSLTEALMLARVCGYLPLALRVAGSLLHNNPALKVVNYLQQLTHEQQRLRSLHDPDDPGLNVEAALRLSYARLEAQVQQLFRQLGVLVADFTSKMAQAVIQIPAPIDIEATLHELLRHNLVMYDTERSRWRLHDLLRDLARHELELMDEAEAIQSRYAWAIVALAEQIQEHYLAGGEKALLALSQFDTERTHIDAARRWAQRHTQTPEGNQLLLDLALATLSIQELRYDPQQKSTTLWDGVCMAARRLGKPTEEARALNMLGDAYAHLNKLHTAISYYEQCLAITQALGDRRTESLTLHNLGLVYTLLGKSQIAISYYEQNLAIAREIGDRRSEAATLGNLGLAYQLLGKPHTAINYHQQDLAIVRQLGNHRGEGVTLSNLGNSYTELGDTERALEYCQAALRITRAIGDRRGEGYALSYLARAQAIQGDTIQASICFTQAMALFQEVSHRWGIAKGQWYFGLALVQHGEREQGLALLRASVAYEQKIGHTKAEEHTTLVAHLEVGEELPPQLRILKAQHAIGDDQETSTENEV